MKFSWTSLMVGALLAIIITSIYIGYEIMKPEHKLRVFNPADINPELVDSTLLNVRSQHTTLDFSLTDQYGNTITQEAFKGKIFVTDFFFTTCKTICPKMTSQLKRVQDVYKDADELMFLSHTVTPDIDTPEVLFSYAESQGANHEKWKFVTGDKKVINSLARKSYFACTTGVAEGEEDFVHTENLVLVDKERRLRGFYDGTSTEDVDRLISEIRILLNEYQK